MNFEVKASSLSSIDVSGSAAASRQERAAEIDGDPSGAFGNSLASSNG